MMFAVVIQTIKTLGQTTTTVMATATTVIVQTATTNIGSKEEQIKKFNHKQTIFHFLVKLQNEGKMVTGNKSSQNITNHFPFLAVLYFLPSEGSGLPAFIFAVAVITMIY